MGHPLHFIVYMLSSIYAVGYMRLLNEEERLPLFYGLFSGFAFTMLGGLHHEQCGRLLDCDRADHPDQHIPGGIRTEAESTEAAWKYIVVVSAASALLCWALCFSIGVARLSLGQAMR